MATTVPLQGKEPRNKIRRVCVFCGARTGSRAEFVEQAEAFGRELARKGWGLVYGGGTVGVMGAVAKTAHDLGVEVIGVIPKALCPREVSGEMIGTTIFTTTMHERKEKLSAASDCFVALPGGFGTFEELFEVITWQQLGIHRKPIGVLNTAGYFDPLVALIENGVTSGFISPEMRTMVVVESDAAVLVDRLEHHEPPPGLVKWLSDSDT